MSYPSPHNPLHQYRAVDAYGAAASSDRMQLILRLMQGALDRIISARGHMQRREVALKGEALGRAVRMIDGLRACLDHQNGGDIATNLAALYEYMTRRLTEGNLRNDPRALDEVADLLDEIRSGWEQVAASPALRVVPPEDAGAGRGVA
ncbi:MAG: flagellar export chaperone FliS [Gammaproteobacteria bacterium]|nr:flagellar export chaperone FliS [Gammaproteobacteria bacterium]